MKNLASQSGLDCKGYFDLCEDIHRRYQLQFEGLDFAKAPNGDDPMGLSDLFMGEEDRDASESPCIVMVSEPSGNKYMRAVEQKGMGQDREMDWIILDMAE